MLVLYNLGIRLYHFLILVASLFNKKASLFVSGRKKVFSEIRENLPLDREKIWFHCASLGEFEQARPLIETIKKTRPDVFLIVSFFSPSGYEIRKNYDHADFVCYLPADTASNAKKFITGLNPSRIVFVKYDIWYHYIKQAGKMNIPVFLVSANFRPGQIYFRWYGKFFLNTLKKLETIFVQNSSSKDILSKYNLQNVKIAGDLRFDKVFETSLAGRKNEIIETFSENNPLLIGGSTWTRGEELIHAFYTQKQTKISAKIIIAPHNVDRKNAERIKGLFGEGAILFSDSTPEIVRKFNVLIIDNIGMLASIYSYGTIAYIGGGFQAALHNALEATAFGLPVIVGPGHYKFPEVKEMIGLKIAYEVIDEKEFVDVVNELLGNKDLLAQKSEEARQFVLNRKGATGLILSELL